MDSQTAKSKPEQSVQSAQHESVSSRAEAWAETMHGHEVDAGVTIRLAHADSWAGSGSRDLVDRLRREELEDANLT
ncbi:MAG: hypothetical protein ACKOFM_02155, partial [Actinomycetota bacterium]